MRASILTPALLAPRALAQWVAQDGRGLRTVRSPGDERITVSYKVPEGVCTTASEAQQQYTGWVNVPAPGDVDYETNLFFWFVGAREETDALTIWLNGGPGSSSMYGFWTGNGPCEVVERGVDRYETVARDWGWDRATNMLFIDQPNKVGFSYSKPTNGTRYLVQDTVASPPDALNDTAGVPAWSVLNGTFSGGPDEAGAISNPNTTSLAAEAVWHMVQGLLTTMPQFRAKPAMEVHLFAESYGGRYGPVFAEYFAGQNARRAAGELDRAATRDVHLVSLGIVNGLVDLATQAPYYPIFAVNNTYGVAAVTESAASYYLETYGAPGGCKERLEACSAAAERRDPDEEGDSSEVNEMCGRARQACAAMEQLYYRTSGRGAYDIAANTADPFPSGLFEVYLNQADVQRAIGAPVNFTMSNTDVFLDFASTGDMARGGNIGRLAALVASGVRVGLVYGDRDYICNWLGGEAVSLAVAEAAGDEYARRFAAAGYAPIAVNDSYTGGVVRQYGNLSFSRVYQAGHAMPAYQPETAFRIFERVAGGASVADGTGVALGSYGTEGPGNATHTDVLPEPPAPTCWVRWFGTTCGGEALAVIGVEDGGRTLGDGGVVVNGKLYAKEEDFALWGADEEEEEGEEEEEEETNEGDEEGAGAGGARVTGLLLGGSVLLMVYLG